MLSIASKRVLRVALARPFSVEAHKVCQSGILPEGNNSAYFGIYNLNYERVATPEGRQQLIDAVKGFDGLLSVGWIPTAWLLSAFLHPELLREDASGNKQVIHLDLTRADIVNSDYYYLQQNDIIYVKPTKARVMANSMSNNTSSWISWVSLVATIASLVVVSLR